MTRRLAALAGALCLGLLGGCASTGAAPAGSVGTTGPSVTSVDRSDAGSVAVAFTLAMASQDYAAASVLLDPDKRGVLAALAQGSQGQPGTQATGTLRGGRQRITGDSGTVALVGRLCRIMPVGAPGPVPTTPDCIENADPDTESPLFTVRVVRLSGQWYVTFVTPSVSGATSNHPPT
jgi:hypothetical protein